MCLSHLIYTVRPCLIHTCHTAPMPCMGTAWARHAMCESTFICLLALPLYWPRVNRPIVSKQAAGSYKPHTMAIGLYRQPHSPDVNLKRALEFFIRIFSMAPSGPSPPHYRDLTITLKHSYSIGLLWTSDQPDGDTFTC